MGLPRDDTDATLRLKCSDRSELDARLVQKKKTVLYIEKRRFHGCYCSTRMSDTKYCFT